MGVNTESLNKTTPWPCPKCGTNINVPSHILRSGETITCPNCEFHGVLPRTTIPFKCVKCGSNFIFPESLRALGGHVFCPVCHQKYRRASRRIVADVCQDHGRLIPVKD